MKRRLARMPIRIRLTLAFALVMAAVLTAAGAFVYLRLRSELDAGLDAGLRARAADIATLLRSTENGLEANRPGSLAARDETFAQVLTTRGRVFDATPEVRSTPLIGGSRLVRARTHEVMVARSVAGVPEGPARLLAVPVRAQDRSLVVVIGASLEARDEALSSLVAIMLVGGPVALLLASLTGYGVAAGALRPVDAMRRAADAVAVAGPGARLPVPPGDDELSRLGRTLNALLARQADALAREREFVSDASHELRTPLSILRSELELALERPRTREALEEALRSAAEESDRLNQLAEDLLVIARSDQGRLPIRLEELDAVELLGDVRRRFRRRAAQAGRALGVCGRDPGPALGDRLRLEQALGNLVENALRHGAGPIGLEARAEQGRIELHVTDRGDGFPPGFAERAFHRFTRADPARERGGSGLGLAIVDAIASAHGGSAGARSRPGGGADVWIAIPARPAGEARAPRRATA